MQEPVVTEDDFRLPQYRGANPQDYEFDSSGVPVRKDRWKTTVFAIAGLLELDSREGFELSDILRKVEELCQASEPGGEWTPVGSEDFPALPEERGHFDVLMQDGSLLRNVLFDPNYNLESWNWSGKTLGRGVFPGLRAWRLSTSQETAPD